MQKVIHITKPVSMNKADAIGYFKEIIDFLKKKGITPLLASQTGTKKKLLVREPDEEDFKQFKEYLTFLRSIKHEPLYISEVHSNITLEAV